MFKKLISAPILLFILIVFIGCAMTQQNKYEQNLTTEAQVAAIMEQYDIWYQMMSPDVQADWDKVFTPAFDQLDLLMDSYHNIVANNLETVTILAEINRLKTRIMIELTKRMADKDKPTDTSPSEGGN